MSRSTYLLKSRLRARAAALLTSSTSSSSLTCVCFFPEVTVDGSRVVAPRRSRRTAPGGSLYPIAALTRAPHVVTSTAPRSPFTVHRSHGRGFRADTPRTPPRPPAPTAPARAPGPRPTWRRTPAVAKAVHATRHIRRVKQRPAPPRHIGGMDGPLPLRRGHGVRPDAHQGEGQAHAAVRIGPVSRLQIPGTGAQGELLPEEEARVRRSFPIQLTSTMRTRAESRPPNSYLTRGLLPPQDQPPTAVAPLSDTFGSQHGRRTASSAPDVVRTADQGQHHAAGRRDPARGDLSERMPGPATKQPQRRVQESSPALGLGAMRSTCRQNGRSAPWGLAVADPSRRPVTLRRRFCRARSLVA